MQDRQLKKGNREPRLNALVFAVMVVLYWAHPGILAAAPSSPAKATGAVHDQKTTLASASTGTTAAHTEQKQVAYAYNPGKRIDPFAPIIVKAAQRSKTGNRPPLERYSISEFKLSGIIWGGFGYNAILEGPDGKGYFVRVGTLLGPNGGVIKKITQSSMVVEEKYKNYAGEFERKEFVKQLPGKQEVN